ncbi:MAG: CotH kinase family protein [Bacteroides sp.]|nr:CotH kinase family protein [Roseburia sp.]MCM1347148.1 CotH kinase family protein [Bacteroides sp.]MCM1420608.1 CotH kinase family protein [Bacteroides sp.]
MRRRLWGLILLFLAIKGTCRTQPNEYEQIKASINSSSLPLVNIIVTNTADINPDTYTDGEIEITDFQKRTDGITETQRYHCQYRYRGASSRKYQKKSFAIKLKDSGGNSLDTNILGMRLDDNWILDAMAIDRIRMRNRICFDCWNALSSTPYTTNYNDRNGTEGVFVEVFVNGDYHGLYCMTDKINRKLLGLKKAKTDDTGLQTVRGVLYKGISWESGCGLLEYEDADMSEETWNAWELQYPDDYPSVATWQPLTQLIDFCSGKTSISQFRKEYQNWFYTDNLVDYIVFTQALNVGDNLYKNTFLSAADLTQEHRYLITPWDMDMSLGGYYNGEYNNYLSDMNRYNNKAPFNRLYVQNIDQFKDKVRARWKELSETHLSVRQLENRMDKYAEQFRLSGAWEREYTRWNNNPVALKEDVSEELEYVKDWYQRNYNMLYDYFDIPNAIPTVENKHTRFGIYTLEGRKINSAPENLPKGLYIINGEKTVIK